MYIFFTSNLSFENKISLPPSQSRSCLKLLTLNFFLVGDGQLEITEKHEAEQFLRVFEHVKSLSDTSVGDTTAEESRLSKRLSELMPKEYNPGFAFVVVQKRINTRVLAVNRRGPKVRIHTGAENLKDKYKIDRIFKD